MRDGEIYRGLSSTNKRVSRIYRQMVFIDTRLQAFEAVFAQRWAALRFLFAPAMIFKSVDTVHLALMKKHDDDMRQRVADEAKPKINVIHPGMRVVGPGEVNGH